eukprot:snap_masked-scaffold15_size728074-processed-gene-6.8 protein:Tk08875 transcript:snap_masked-scaffold15_size728074-processed-gene-6.8-mRNA-1 annotation:"histone deacetylase 11-like isoform x1"
MLRNALHLRPLSSHTPSDLSRQLETIRGLPIVHTESYVCYLPPGHRFQMKKFRGVYQTLVNDRVIDPKTQVVEPLRASEELASLAHDPDYVRRFYEGQTSQEEQRRTGFEWTHGLASRVRYETGGTVLATMISIERGLCCSTGGGTHHAGPDYGSGYCLINDLAVAAQNLVDSYPDSKVLIIDLDVHQGDGTALIFKDEPRVFTLSVHGEKNFPFRKQKSDLDLGLNDGLGDKDYLQVLQEHIPRVLDEFRPNFVLYDAGVDVHAKDSLGRLELSDHGLWQRDAFVLKECLSEYTSEGFQLRQLLEVATTVTLKLYLTATRSSTEWPPKSRPKCHEAFIT